MKTREKIYMVSLRGFKSAFYEEREKAEALYCYCRRHFGPCSFVVTDHRRVIKNLYLMRNC